MESTDYSLRAQRKIPGQSLVEYAVVLAAFMAVVVALGALWRLMEQGAFVEHALASATYCLQAMWSSVLTDMFLY